MGAGRERRCAVHGGATIQLHSGMDMVVKEGIVEMWRPIKIYGGTWRYMGRYASTILPLPLKGKFWL